MFDEADINTSEHQIVLSDEQEEGQVQEEEKRIGSVSLDGVPYAVSLMWQPLQDPDSPMSEIKLVTDSDPSFDLYCLYNLQIPQYGLGKRRNGQSVGMPALAVSIASYFSEISSVCGVFKVPDGWWLIAIRNNLILSEQDVFFEKEEEAKEALRVLLKVPNWDKIIVPEDWGIENAESISILTIVQDAPKVRLQELSNVRKKTFLMVASIILLVLVMSILYYFGTYLNSLDVEAVNRPLPVVVPKKKIEKDKDKETNWTRIPESTAFINKCWNNIFMLQSVIIPGWKIGELECTPRGLKSQWVPLERGRNLAIIEAALEEYKLDKVDVKVSENGIAADAFIAFSDLPYVKITMDLNINKLQHELIDFQQATGLPLLFTKETMSVITELGERPEENVTQILAYFSFNVPSAYTPWEWAPFFEKFVGLELTKIVYNPESVEEKWRYEGRIYAQ